MVSRHHGKGGNIKFEEQLATDLSTMQIFLYKDVLPAWDAHQEKTADIFIPYGIKWEICKNWFFFIPKRYFFIPSKTISYPEISVRPSKQPLMVRSFLQVYMELGSYFLFLQEQIKDIIILLQDTCVLARCRRASRENWLSCSLALCSQV